MIYCLSNEHEPLGERNSPRGSHWYVSCSSIVTRIKMGIKQSMSFFLTSRDQSDLWMAMINLLMLQRPFRGEVCWTNTWRNIKGVFEKTADLHLLCVRGRSQTRFGHAWRQIDVWGGGRGERGWDVTLWSYYTGAACFLKLLNLFMGKARR